MKPPLYDLAQVLQKEAARSDRPFKSALSETIRALTPCIGDPLTLSFRVLLPLSHDALEAILVPLDRLGLVDAVRGADVRLTASALGDTLAGAGPVFVVSNTVR
jgi:hypothetical protein